ncbi:MAG: hypothetical protein EOO91_01135 [Pedobacter sp.]|nr:MAG: hypothetical protein EOO91_01135 [Pedobacter sp.]
MKRPLFNYTIEQLELEYKSQKNNPILLLALEEELGFRNSARAERLLNEVLLTISNNKEWHQESDRIESERTKQDQPKVDIDDLILDLSDKEGYNVISAWSALEVLSPQTFIKPQQLAQNGDVKLVASLQSGALPWEGLGEKSKLNYQLFYHIILGTIKVSESVDLLVKVYGDTNEEKPAKRGEAPIASIIVNNKGLLVEAPAVSISSFAWALPKALNGNLSKLGEWSQAEKKLQEGLEVILRGKGTEDEVLPLTLNQITDAYNWIIDTLALPANLVKPNLFAIRYYHYYKSGGSPEGLLLNSFYLRDLELTKKLIKENKITPILKKYLGLETPIKEYNLFENRKALEEAISPQNFPPCRWPCEGLHPLVLLQQAAVNLTFKNLKRNGILPVNGPPGTGKTTLLRDIIAGIITQRAEAMCAFDDPQKAFATTGQKINVGQGWLHLYKVDQSLKGYEILIASSNNKAVENVSTELPAINAISSLFPELRYYKILSDVLHGKETWGLIAAVLGNGKNKNLFIQRFWWDKEVGMQTYLAEASGNPQWIEEKNPETGEVVKPRKPKAIINDNAPPNAETAILIWRKIRQDFKNLLADSRSRLAALEQVRLQVLALPLLRKNEDENSKNSAVLLTRYTKEKVELTSIEEEHNQSNIEKQYIEKRIELHKQIKPGFFKRLFGSTSFEIWKLKQAELLNELEAKLLVIKDIYKRENQKSNDVKLLFSKYQSAQIAHRKSLSELQAANDVVVKSAAKIGNHFINEDFVGKEFKDIQLIAPWCNFEMQQIRDKVFISAMKVHKAFNDAAAQKLRHNLGVMMMVLSGKKMADKEKEQLIPDLWSSLFLVVPSISTTFASIERMLGNMPPESLGWVLIDEAGQAVPQAAVGAIVRAKRAVVVGDPFQIEPVVSLPDILTDKICKHFKIDHNRFNAPISSVQTVADATSAYVATFDSSNGFRKVGVPLLVHRRCTEPMFTISNLVAYDRKMVQAKKIGSSPIRDLIGSSKWFNVNSDSADKWSEQEGELVINMLLKIKERNLEPNLYIITPFLIVAENLRTLIYESRIMHGWVEDPDLWPNERIGTVHTVQGREAEAVIFVLGAPAAGQKGARNWAGSKPNILNVAVTRAKEVIYVIGNRSHWESAGLFSQLSSHLPK